MTMIRGQLESGQGKAGPTMSRLIGLTGGLLLAVAAVLAGACGEQATPVSTPTAGASGRRAVLGIVADAGGWDLVTSNATANVQ